MIFSTSIDGDPVNVNAPGTYEQPGISHPADPQMAPTRIVLSGQPVLAAKPGPGCRRRCWITPASSTCRPASTPIRSCPGPAAVGTGRQRDAAVAHRSLHGRLSGDKVSPSRSTSDHHRRAIAAARLSPMKVTR